MNELRLIDPDGYTVPGTVHTGFPAAMEGELRAHLRTVAEHEAAQWADFGHRAADYRIEPATPQNTLQETAMPRPEFLTLPTDALVAQRSICLRPELGEDPRMREVLADRASDELDRRAEAEAA